MIVDETEVSKFKYMDENSTFLRTQLNGCVLFFLHRMVNLKIRSELAGTSG